jgi:hypothetical protein
MNEIIKGECQPELSPDNPILDRLSKVLELYEKGDLGGEIMPEDALLDIVPAHELPDVITLGMALNYQRNSYTLWKSVAEAYQDEDTKWLFNTQLAKDASEDELRTALVRHKVGLQPNKHTQIWHKIAGSLADAGGALALIDQHDQTIAALKETMQKTRKKDFPYLSGPKIFNYWLYVMESYCDVQWHDRDEISVAPDTHILQASVQLGLVPATVLDGTNISREQVAQAWRELLKDSELSPIDVHTPLWLWSRSNFLEV